MEKSLSEFMAKHFLWSGQYPTPKEIWDASKEAAEANCQCLQKRKAGICPECNGSGDDPNWRHGSVGICNACGGTGKRSAGTQ